MKKNDNKYTGKVAIVTGASSGIGLATAKMLMSKGVKVYGLAYNDFADNFEYRKVDVTSPEQIETVMKEIFEKEGRIDYLVNCAGMGISGSVENSPNDKIKKIFDVNFFGTVNMCKAVIPYMRKNNFGRENCLFRIFRSVSRAGPRDLRTCVWRHRQAPVWTCRPRHP